MRFHIIDYSQFFYTEQKGAHVPSKRSGKFVQIKNRNEEFLVISPRGLSVYHANIAERFFSDKGVRGHYNSKRDEYKLSTRDWIIIGGGFWSIDEQAKSLELSGESMAYGMFDPSGLIHKINATDGWAAYSVSV